MIDTNEKYILISSPVNHENFGSRIVLLVVLFGVSLTFFFLGFSHEPYMAFGYVILGLICLIVTLIVLRRVLNLEILKITKIAIFWESIRGKSIVINREDIVSFHEKHLEETSNKRVDKWDELLLFTKDDYITVSSKIHPDYKKVKLTLTAGLKDFLNDSLYRTCLNLFLLPANDAFSIIFQRKISNVVLLRPQLFPSSNQKIIHFRH
ncbi:hypothetical protein [Emticicia soli]|uniref:Uncharacterized protein n=1 Tax=Emticicia soli TaxID=2027878 RepID=A0ABW5JEH3_9BACT